MNPFAQLPPDAAGVRGFKSAAEAKASAMAQEEVKSFVVLEHKMEFAWIAPLDLVMARMTGCIVRGINVVEMCTK